MKAYAAALFIFVVSAALMLWSFRRPLLPSDIVPRAELVAAFQERDAAISTLSKAIQELQSRFDKHSMKEAIHKDKDQ